MKSAKGALISAALSSVVGFGFALASSASGPMVMAPMTAPITAPKVMAMTVQRTTQLQKQVLNAYRQLRSFWLSRGIVR